MNVIGLFIQDAWTINNKLTINAGVRTEQREAFRTYAPDVEDRTLPDFGIEFGFADKMAPRVGFAYDVNGDGRTKVFGSWGIFYDIFKLELPRGSFGGDKWLEYYYTLDTFDWPNLVASAACPPACPGTLMRIDRLPAHLGRQQRDRAGPEADEAAGSDGRRRAPAERPDGGRASATSTSRSTARSRTRRPRRSTPTATRSTSSPTRARVSPSRRSGRLTVRSSPAFRSRSATTTASSSRSRSASPTTGTSAAATCGAGCMATTRGCPSRTRTGAPARTSAASTTTR